MLATESLLSFDIDISDQVSGRSLAQEASRVPTPWRSGGLRRRFRGGTVGEVGEFLNDFRVSGSVAAGPGPADMRDGGIMQNIRVFFCVFKKLGLAPQLIPIRRA